MPHDAATNRFRAAFCDIEPLAIARAPGRVNLIGEHIDYNDGIVLPIAINLETRVVIGRAGDERIRVRSAARSGELNFDAASVPRHLSREWDGYVRGVAAQLIDRGVRLPGCAVWIDSDILTGAGLSSSAALEVALALALLAAAGTTLPMRDIADLCREAEHRFAGVPCGIMDQYASALAKNGHALAIDCRDRSVRHIAWPEANPAVLIVDTGMERKLATGVYAERVRECAEALAIIRASGSNVAGWRDVTPAHLTSTALQLQDRHRRRARHVINEIARTRHAIAAMERGDCARFGELMRESHASLRDDYEVSLPEIDLLVEQFCAMDGVYGAKLTGAGFGGCIVALADRAAIGSIRAQIGSKRADSKAAAQAVSVVAPAQGASFANV